MRTTYTSDKILNLYRGTTFTAPATVYAALLTSVTDAEAGTVAETAYSGYARIAITFGAPAAGSPGRKILNSLLAWAAKGDAGSATFIAVGIYDALTVGNLLDVCLIFDGDPIAVAALAADLAADLLQSPGHGLAANDQVRLEAFPGSGTLPTGLSENTTYFVIATGLTADAFKLSATQGGAAIDITAIGKALLLKLLPVVVNQNDTPQIAANKLALTDD